MNEENEIYEKEEYYWEDRKEAISWLQDALDYVRDEDYDRALMAIEKALRIVENLDEYLRIKRKKEAKK